jgi:hypothetical protein
MVEFLKFVAKQTSFDPELVEVLASALDDAWCRIEKSGSRLARAGYARAMREVIAKHIIEAAQQGMNDPVVLADDAVHFFVANYTGNCKSQATERFNTRVLK